VGGDKGKGTGRCGEEPSVLSKIEERDGGGRSTKSSQTFPEGVPFLSMNEFHEAGCGVYYYYIEFVATIFFNIFFCRSRILENATIIAARGCERKQLFRHQFQNQ
jgi:hypothetical protein